jgi:hypothetical protein
MVKFNLRDYLMSMNIQEPSFFLEREMLFGNTCADLFMKDPQYLKQTLNDLRDKYTNELESHTIICSDFYYQNPIMRALRNGGTKTATILI